MITRAFFFIEHIYQMVYFFYGLVFFTMGITILNRTQKESHFKLAKSLWLLATFGILHAFTEWGRIFIGITSNHVSDESIEKLIMLRDFLRACSFLFLFYFGAKLIYLLKGKSYRYLTYLANVLFILWLSIFAFSWEDANIWSRYLLAMPASLLTSYAFYSQREQIKKLNYPNIDKYILGSSILFVIYFFLGGLFVPTSSFPPASFLNENNFFLISGIPIEVMRILFGITTAIFVTQTINLFNMENIKKTNIINEIITVNRERERISRDMHDGILQSIYAVGLKLEMTKKIIIKNKIQNAVDEIGTVQDNLETIMQDIRNYIFEQHKVRISESDFKSALATIVNNLQKVSVAKIDLQINDDFISPFSNEQNIHLFHIITELVYNAIKHSQSSYIQVTIIRDIKSIELQIADNGIGIKKLTEILNSNDYKHFGLKNVHDRVKILGGTININSLIGYRTTIDISIPWRGE